MTPQQQAMLNGNWPLSQRPPQPRPNYDMPTAPAPWYAYPWANYQQSSGYVQPDIPYQQVQQQPQIQPNQQPPTPQTLLGRYIQNSSEIKPNEVPMDGRVTYFPSQDGSVIVTKFWDQTGTLREIPYVPQIAANEIAAMDGEKPSFPTVQDIDAAITPKLEFINNRLQAIEAFLAGNQAGSQPARASAKSKKEEV